MDRRRNTRLDINLPCRLNSPRLGSGSWRGVTEKISRGDVVVTLSAAVENAGLPEAGDPVLLEIDLPANHAFGPKCMQCQTTVIRVTQDEAGRSSVVMRIHKMRFQSLEPGAERQLASGNGAQQLLM